MTIFLDDIEKLKKEFDNVPYFKTYVEQLHKNLHLLKRDFFKKGDNIDSNDFIEFEKAFKKNIEDADAIFLLASDRVWNQNIMPILKGFLGITIGIGSTVLTLGIAPLLVANNPNLRDMYKNTFFKTDTENEIKHKKKWKSLEIRQQLFEHHPENKEPGLFDEIKKSVTRHEQIKR